jgi:hypothetical protein
MEYKDFHEGFTKSAEDPGNFGVVCPPDHWHVPDVVINNSQDFEAYTSGGQTP